MLSSALTNDDDYVLTSSDSNTPQNSRVSGGGGCHWCLFSAGDGHCLPLSLACPDVEPESWPDVFSCNFSTGTGATGAFLYDWTIKASRVDHAANSYECTNFYNVTGSCVLYYPPAESQMYAYFPDTRTCCKDAAIGTPPPDWGSQSNGTFLGVKSIADQRCRGWSYEDDDHEYWATMTSPSLPVFFTFRDITQQDWTFDLTSFSLKQHDVSNFLLPDGVDCSKPCPSPSTSAVLA